MKKNCFKLLCIAILIVLLIGSLVACGTVNASVSVGETPATTDDDSQSSGDIPKNTAVSTAKFNEGVVLLKTESFDKTMLGTLQYKSVDVLYKNSLWHKVVLEENASTQDAVAYLRDLNTFDKVDYDYIMGSDGEVESIDISSNPNSSQQTYLDTHKIKDAWGYLKDNDKTAGGSPDVVVAVIDTGVDYNHVDLRNNIWVNTGEIPGNGIDDDGNGYVDDYYGWNCVGDNNDPMDDNGHGTHVAGIIAAENNSFGTVGVAYNCKVMCIKAGNSSGYFNNSDIAEAIQYAYMNGASVINMSFGGSSISIAVEDALENAYNQCVLVSAAGNDGLCNNLGHAMEHAVGVSYPAALPYVVGVMSTDLTGLFVSPFSNYDDTPYNSIEYEVYACGAQIPSTWPNNKIATLSGTSMAAPMVSGIAALLRSKFSDREVYSTKYLQSQIVNTGSIHPYNETLDDVDYDHSVANLYEALTKVPKPAVSLYDYYIFDNTEYSDKNNGDGIINAGETIHLAIELHNRGGVASNVVATIDTIRNGDASLVDPYFEIINSSINMSNIGTYSVRDCGKLKGDNGFVVGTTLYFEIKVADDCPNDYLASFNVHINYTNGLDDSDLYKYASVQQVNVTAYNAIILPGTIDDDKVYDGNRIYIIEKDLIISNGVTVEFGPGSILKYYDAKSKDVLKNSPIIYVFGKLILNGTEDKRITVSPSDGYESYPIKLQNNGQVSCSYVDFVNVLGYNSSVTNSRYEYCTFLYNNLKIFNEDKQPLYSIDFSNIHNSYIDISFTVDQMRVVFDGLESCVIDYQKRSKHLAVNSSTDFTNCSDCIFNFWGSANHIVGLSGISNSIIYDPNPNANTNDTLPILLINNATNNVYTGRIYRYPSIIISNYLQLINDPSFSLEKRDEFDDTKVWPTIKTVAILDKDGNTFEKVGKEPFTIRVEFSKAMDRTQNTSVLFGSVEPYADYEIKGEYISDTVWEGQYTLRANIENGTQHIVIKNARAADDTFQTLVDNYLMYTFDIDTTSALSMSMQANAVENGIALEWEQDDYDTLMGYNVYRSEEKDGNFVKLNRAAIPAGENTFVDENAEPGKTYWYTFTVVLSDMSESKPAGKISCTVTDTIAPSIYHTPVNQGYKDNNLVISCTASDNISIAYVKLYYRQCGTTTWKVLTMSKMNDKYSATIFGNEMTLDGVEYYIVASDGRNEISKGTADTPYTIVVKDASEISRIGDVDGDGRITTKDALMIMQSINGDLLLSDDQFKRADLNGDGVLSSVEALRILQYINGNVSTLEMK